MTARPRRSARSIVTKREARTELWRDGSPKVLAAAIGLSAVARRRAGPWRPADAVPVGVVAAMHPFAEWVLHRHVLHRPPLRLFERTIDVAAGHRAHHRDPDRVDQILLGGRYAIADSLMIATGMRLGAPVLARLVHADPVRATRTALVAACAALAVYEWSHLLIHTSYQPASAWFARVRTNHRLHHHRNEHYWMGITSNLADRAFGTDARRTDVPLSTTARTLGVATG